MTDAVLKDVALSSRGATTLWKRRKAHHDVLCVQYDPVQWVYCIKWPAMTSGSTSQS